MCVTTPGSGFLQGMGDVADKQKVWGVVSNWDPLGPSFALSQPKYITTLSEDELPTAQPLSSASQKLKNTKPGNSLL